MYKVFFHPAFKKDTKKLHKKLIERLEKVTDEIAENPHNCERLKGVLHEVYRHKIRFLKVEYRLAFVIENSEIIFLMFRKRENFYKYLKRRLTGN